jgi:AcrR family transcriptional regulator
MPEQVDESPRKRRAGLSRERVLEGAVAIADADGIGALTIRSLAQHLGVKPMSLYYYVANKSEILDAIVDVVFREIDLPTVDGDWRSEIRLRAHSARQVLRRHSWAIGLLESRSTPGPDTLRHHDAMLFRLEDLLDPHAEQRGNTERERQARIVLFVLERVHRLT